MYTEAEIPDRWRLADNGGILWSIGDRRGLPHRDHLEMSGKLVSQYVIYGADEKGELELEQYVVWPALRTIPNNTHASLKKRYGRELRPDIKADGASLSEEKVREVRFDGLLAIKSVTKQNIEVTRTLFPSREHAAAVERIKLKNISGKAVVLAVEPAGHTDVERGTLGIYMLEVMTVPGGDFVLRPEEEISVGVVFYGRKLMEKLTPLDINEEERKRRAFVGGIINALRLETPVPLLDQAFAFAKVRTAESVFQTKNGLMHCPGGLDYYAAVWTNDQAEYAGPFFPFLGHEDGVGASLNCYRLYMPFMGPDYRPIPSSIIAEGADIWEGAGDRGDAAMYAYGASRFALAAGDESIGGELWPAVEWCLEYCRRKTMPEGVVASDSDELEGRFPSGKANLSTSALAYGALRSAAHLGRALGKAKEAEEYDRRAEKLEDAIEEYFGAHVEGYDTYRYYEGNDVLRSWICLPLAMGILKRKKGTVDALFSPNLWMPDGLATQSGGTVFWDRSTLYGFRCVFAAGETERALQYLLSYSRRRTVGEHVPYAVEACPEGNQRHLSAESALYCRIFTEGIFGITPTGFNSFACAPNLPEEWPAMAFKGIRAFGREFDLSVERHEDDLKLCVAAAGGFEKTFTCRAGEAVQIEL